MELDGHFITHIFEIRLSELLLRPINGDPPSEDIVGSLMLADVALNCPKIPNDDNHCVTSKRKRKGVATNAQKRRKLYAPTLTRKWQEKWACKFV